MSDAFLSRLKGQLPNETLSVVNAYLERLEQGEYQQLLQSPEAKELFFPDDQQQRFESNDSTESESWSAFVVRRLQAICSARPGETQSIILFCIGYAALLAFVQANITGSPLKFRPSTIILPEPIATNRKLYGKVQTQLLAELSVDGIAPYKLTPNIELYCFAKSVMNNATIQKNVKIVTWARMRTTFVHQRLLSETSSTIQNSLYDDLDTIESGLDAAGATNVKAEFLLERSAIHIHHGLDKLARKDIDAAAEQRQFDFALTGLLGKRTKFQEKETSQLVVLAKSHGGDDTSGGDSGVKDADVKKETNRPTNLDLNDDTLLESISFSEVGSRTTADLRGPDALSATLKSLDPGNQPQLEPIDSIILLALASSITNTSPQHGLTREETLPYATRVLEGGSSNWQVYTQALLVRSRIEGYKSRTIERGLLQLQALVDQVIADTKGADAHNTDGDQAPSSTFLPRAEDSESAPVTDRVRYIFQIATPFRWELEAELASRWVSLGGLRSALGIYERLEMWAEAALCWAATEREDKAKRMVRRQLYHTTGGEPGVPDGDAGEDEEWTGPERSPPPLDAPRLYCILGDIDKSVEMYEKAWDISGERYARAQRSLGRHYLALRDHVKAAGAYSKSLQVDRLNHASWFALGCSLLELGQFDKAVEAFSRCIQLDESDAESWSNLAAALLRTEPDAIAAAAAKPSPTFDDEDVNASSAETLDAGQAVRMDALKALTRAATLKRESYRIWENVLIVAASLRPPDFVVMLSAMRRIIELRAASDGEGAVDIDLVEKLVLYVISISSTYDAAQPGIQRMVVKFVDESVTPLITKSARLWRLQWNEVVEATVRLCDSYESLGPRERTEGLSAGELVAKDWKFKARSAVRGINSRGKDVWEDTDGWERLKQVLADLKN
ncbi:TPR-like protein [Dissoconium aciculare CBS 342.82]|uniref:TPR-like protein n=1 Tax=Dissoconium aciculare CBS 342.82 TaxID=1314786 RepID=A0A6J3MA04_9PEZI|nr:TPR-like protein [Dissoconium aciculare CBS 342.82]KAF1823642.1 TPR-like protein [Dissoconium aciculare CBS 342.82]